MITVVAALIEKDGKYLIAKRSTGSSDVLGKWEFPGGKIEEDESPQQALVREIAEEFSCEIAVGEKVEDTTYEYEKVIVRLETYKAQILSGQPVALEHADTKWVAPQNLLAMNFAPADIKKVKKIAIK